MKARVILSAALVGMVLITAGCRKDKPESNRSEESYELGKLGSRGVTEEIAESSKENFSAEDLAE